MRVVASLMIDSKYDDQCEYLELHECLELFISSQAIKSILNNRRPDCKWVFYRCHATYLVFLRTFFGCFFDIFMALFETILAVFNNLYRMFSAKPCPLFFLQTMSHFLVSY